MTTLSQAAIIAALKNKEGWEPNPAAEKFHLLSIGPLERSYALHDALLDTHSAHPFETPEFNEMMLLPDYRELWVVPQQQVVHLAVVRETLSEFELDEACRFIRHRWPTAKIVVVRAGENFLEDALYDDRIRPDTSPEHLCKAVLRLLNRRRG